jgi:hypothetical protein
MRADPTINHFCYINSGHVAHLQFVVQAFRVSVEPTDSLRWQAKERGLLLPVLGDRIIVNHRDSRVLALADLFEVQQGIFAIFEVFERK